MEKEDEFLFNLFTHISQLCFDKAKEHIEKEREGNSVPGLGWTVLLNLFPQLILAEKSYIEIGFLQNKQKSFLRKDNSLRSIYDALKSDIKHLEENSKHNPLDKRVTKYCQHLSEYLTARINLIDFYDKIYVTGSSRFLKYNDLYVHIEKIIEKHVLCFTDIGLTPIKAIFSLECEILQQLFKALTELQRLQFLPSLALIHGAQTRLTAWENKMQNREVACDVSKIATLTSDSVETILDIASNMVSYEKLYLTWKLGFLKNSPLPLLYQWLVRFKGAVLSKFSLYFHDTLAQQTTISDMRQLCSKLQNDYYHRMVQFQRKYDTSTVLLISDNQVSCDTTEYDCFPVIVSCPMKSPPQHETILKMIADTSIELINNDKIIYKYSTQEQCTYVLYAVELNIYLVLIFESKKSEKDVFISNFMLEFATNLRCSKVFISLKNPTK